MLEITVNKSYIDEYTLYITIIIKQSYEFSLRKDDIEIKIPSLYRPVFKFKWNINSPKTVYMEQWTILKNAINQKFPFEIYFNTINIDGTGDKQFISVDNDALILGTQTYKFGENEYRIPIKEHTSELLDMLDDIAKIYLEFYPNMKTPEIFKYSHKQLPIVLVSPYLNYIKINYFDEKYNNLHETHIKISKARQLLQWLNDRTSKLPKNITFENDILVIKYGHMFNTKHLPIKDLDKLKIRLSDVLA